jgi:2-polyprenyl-6-methoxyphenol hydroxylase-like FAD-dependent oxidoreductase
MVWADRPEDDFREDAGAYRFLARGGVTPHLRSVPRVRCVAEEESVRVGVAGAGIGGLTLAAALHRRGVEVAVFEKQEVLRAAGAGISLWPNALAALDACGLGDAVRAVGQPLASGGLMSMDGRPAATFSARAFRAALGEPLVCVKRAELVSALAAQLPAAALLAGTAVDGYTLEAGGVTVRLSGRHDEHVDVLIGADGIASAIAAQIAGPPTWRPSGYTAWRGIAEPVDGPRGDGLWMCLHNGHEFGWLPLRDGRTYWFATAMLTAVESDRPAREYLRAAFKQHPDPVPALIDATPDQALLRNDIIDRAKAARWTDGPIAVLGDAAHPMRPHLGQGGCQAIEDAAAIAHLLQGSHSVAEALRIYERRRRRRAAVVTALSRRAGLTFPAGRRSRALSGALSGNRKLAVGAALHALRPIASYNAGQRAVTGSSGIPSAVLRG